MHLYLIFKNRQNRMKWKGGGAAGQQNEDPRLFKMKWIQKKY